MAIQERGHATRAEILDAAGRVFSSLSYSEAKISDVLELTSAGKGAVYFHFENKQGLARAVLEEGREKLQEAGLSSLVQGTDARSRLHALTSSIAELIAASPVVAGSFRLTLEAAREFPDLTVSPYKMWEPMVGRILAAADDAGELREEVDAGQLTWVIVATFMGSKEMLGLTDSLDQLPERVRAAMDCLADACFVSIQAT